VVADDSAVSAAPASMAPVSISSLAPLQPRKTAAPNPAPAVAAQEPEPDPAPAPVVRASNGLPSLSALIGSGTPTRES
jgi:hypothetical protein